MRLVTLGTIVLAALLAACGAAEIPRADIKAAEWIAPGADRVEALTTRPATCINPDLNSVQADRGELLFNSPLLLGGQAAKAGLSCASCHQNGRGNPSFVLSGLNDTPGIVDVTHGLFSKVRADGTDNPVPIPDLANRSGRKVDRSEEGALEQFLYLQITEEFQGAEPSSQVVSAIAAYLRSLDDRYCSSDDEQALNWETEWARIEVGLDAASQSEDAASRRAYINATRRALGRLHERFPQTSIRETLQNMSMILKGGADAAQVRIAMQGLKQELEDAAAKSFYNPDYFKRGL